MSIARRFLTAMIMCLTLVQARAAESGAPAPVQRAQDFLKRFEALRDVEDPGKGAREKDLDKAGLGDSEANIEEVMEIDAGLKEYLAKSPGDVEAVELLMNFYLVRSYLDVWQRMFAGESDLSKETDIYAAIVDRALAADSSRAALHFWRGWLYSSDIDSLGSENPRLPDAIRETRRAVSLEPKDDRYREALASLLVAAGEDAEARALYRQLRADHPMYLLLHDWERLPAIAGMERMPVSGMPPMMSSMAAIGHLYLFRGTASEFTRRAQAHWPGFRLASYDSTVSPERGFRGGWHLVWKGDVLEVNPKGSKQPDFGAGGIWVDVQEVRASEAEAARAKPPVKPGETVCTVSFVSLRSLGGD